MGTYSVEEIYQNVSVKKKQSPKPHNEEVSINMELVEKKKRGIKTKSRQKSLLFVFIVFSLYNL